MPITDLREGQYISYEGETYKVIRVDEDNVRVVKYSYQNPHYIFERHEIEEHSSKIEEREIK